jgi:hypothetical protein
MDWTDLVQDSEPWRAEDRVIKTLGSIKCWEILEYLSYGVHYLLVLSKITSTD